MTGWTQFTVRYDQHSAAEFVVEDAEASPNRVSYAESIDNIARVRLVGYDKHEAALEMINAPKAEVEIALVADFNDTTDSGEVTVYNDRQGEVVSVANATCPEVGRWSFELSVGGLTETGVRAGNDFSLEEKYGNFNRETIPLNEFERLTEEHLKSIKELAKQS